jgi:ABC-type transport system involved in multi-copper enzyme maturation permease subunit
MLLKLMRKDLILHWRGILPLPLTAIGLFVYSVLRDGEDMSPGLFLTMVALMAGFAPVVVAAREEKLKTRALTCSLPVERTAVVEARYLGAWILFAAYVAIAALEFLVVRGPSALSEIFRPQTVFAMLTAYTFAMGLTMPLVERFGFLGVFVLLIALQLLGLVVMALSFALPGRPTIGLFVDSLRSFTAASRERLGAVLHYALFAAALVAFNAASFGASAAIFRRREI